MSFGTVFTVAAFVVVLCVAIARRQPSSIALLWSGSAALGAALATIVAPFLFTRFGLGAELLMFVPVYLIAALVLWRAVRARPHDG